MGNNDLLKRKIEKIFNDLRITYKNVDFEDEDINYIVKFNTYGKLKSLNSIDGVMYFHHTNFSVNFIVLNIYSLDEDKNDIDTLDIYEAVNDVNSELLYGIFLVEDNKRIFYRSTVNCGLNYIGLDETLIKRQIDIFIDGLVNLFTVIKSKEQNDEQF